jgi:peptidoglycan/xylan/chitin deacetylase (PgdA/CDA1 family)
MVNMSNKVINFHDVYDPVWFEQTITMLKKKYHLVDVEQLEEFYFQRYSLKNACLITVDDGDKTFFEVMFPILVKHKVPAILFVSPHICSTQQNFWFQEIRGFNKSNFNQIISEYCKKDLRSYPNIAILKNLKVHTIWELIEQYKNQFEYSPIPRFNMDNKQLMEVQASNLVKVGAHTLHHPILKNEDNTTSKKEIIQSVLQLEEILKTKIKYFAYPNGIPHVDFDEREFDFLRDGGIRLAFTTEPRNFSKKFNPLAIPRYGLSCGNPVFINTKLMLGPYWNWIKEIRKPSEKALRKQVSEMIKSQ